MKIYTINYFNQKEVRYFGTFKDAIRYAESFRSNLVLSFEDKDSIKIYDDNKLVAEQIWVDDGIGGLEPLDWKF